MASLKTGKKRILSDPHEEEVYSKTVFGFWVYLLSDFMMFAALIATYLVLRNNTFSGPSAKDLFHLPFTLGQTLLLLTASLTAGLGSIKAYQKQKGATVFFFLLTFCLAAGFLTMQLMEFSSLSMAGHNWQKSAFLSAFFTLVGTHAVHVIFGLIWTFVFLFPVWKEGITDMNFRRLMCLKMFWQFLNIVWLFIFAIVYLIR